MTQPNDAWSEFRLALGFLTRLPVGDVGYTSQKMAASTCWYPAVGGTIGALVGMVYLLSAAVLSIELAVLLSVAVGLLLTGALHEDGFADTCDGLGGGRTRETALEIMRDSRIGTYGALGLGMLLATKITALANLPCAIFWVLIAGHTLSRAMMVVVISTADYVRDQGAASGVSGGIDRRGVNIALACSAAVLVPIMALFPVGATVLGCAGLGVGYAVMRWQFEKRLNGYTGDCLGAIQQVSEVGFYLGLLVWL